MPNFSKVDSQGQELNPGDVCVRMVKDGKFNKSKLEFCVYKKASWGGKNSEGKFGRFETPNGPRSIKYSSVLFVFDPINKRFSQSREAKECTRKFYEG